MTEQGSTPGAPTGTSGSGGVGKPPVERAIELMVYAPIGLAMFARDMVPPLLNQFIARGRARVAELQKQVENQVGQARIVGQFAASQGPGQIKREVEHRLQEARERGETIARTVGLRREAPAPKPPSRVEAAPAAPTSGNGSRGDSSNLPIPDYDELSASQVVARLSGLTRDELDAVRHYEEGQRQRKTILTRIEQLES